jgi:hypothetical protein
VEGRRTQIVQHILKMQYVCLLPKYIKCIFWRAAVCISRILDASILTLLLAVGRLNFVHTLTGLLKNINKKWGSINLFFYMKANRIHDCFLKEILACMY